VTVVTKTAAAAAAAVVSQQTPLKPELQHGCQQRAGAAVNV